MTNQQLLKRLQALAAEHTEISATARSAILQQQDEIGRLLATLQKIAAYDPGQFRPLEDEIAIWRLATEALAACSSVPQSAEQTPAGRARE